VCNPSVAAFFIADAKAGPEIPDVPDRIERELVLPAPLARVWAALTEPAGLSAWFGTRATVDLRPGGSLAFIWDEHGTERHRSRGEVETVEPPYRFVFRWQPFAGYETAPLSESPTTRVEFTLEEHPQGTLLRVVESGFASLPPELRGTSFERNTRGWQIELGELAAYIAALA
jgi:uncharacterized protein YndB with AHSA1/START domain